jgi:hypothetical protein
VSHPEFTASDLSAIAFVQSLVNLNDDRAATCGVGVACVF